jgi:lysophospholipase L1-like esterase
VRAVVALEGALPPTADESQREEWAWAARHLRGDGELPSVPGEFDPVLGWKLRPDLRAGGVRTNSAGMRSAAEFAPAPEAGRKRLVLVGDSYTFGSGVGDHETFASILSEELLPGWDVLNLGVPGYGTDQQVLSFERVGHRYHPDVVVLGFFDRDYERNLLHFRGYAKPRFTLTAGGDLELVGVPVPSPDELLAEYASGERRIAPPPSFLLELVRGRLAALAAWRVGDSAEGWRLLARLMERFDRGVRDAGAEPLWMVIPDRRRVERTSARFDSVADLMEAHAEAIGLPHLGLLPALSAAQREANAYPDKTGGHLSARGHRAVALALAAELVERGWAEPPGESVEAGPPREFERPRQAALPSPSDGGPRAVLGPVPARP